MAGRIVGGMMKPKALSVKVAVGRPSGNVPDMADKGLPFEPNANDAMMSGESDEGQKGPMELYQDAMDDLTQLAEAVPEIAQVLGRLQGLEAKVQQADQGGEGNAENEGQIAPGETSGKNVSLAG